MPGLCAGASHFTSTEDTISAFTGSDDPKPHSTLSPIRCSPPTFTTPTPAVGPDAGCTKRTAASGWNANSILLVLNPPSEALTSRDTIPAAWGGDTHVTSIHPKQRSFAPSWSMQSSSPPTYSAITTSMPKRHRTDTPAMPLPITRTAVPPEIGPADGATAYTAAEDMYSKAASDMPHTSLFELADTATSPPSRAGAAHSAPYPATRLDSGPMVPKRHPATELASRASPRASLTMVPPLWGPREAPAPPPRPRRRTRTPCHCG